MAIQFYMRGYNTATSQYVDWVVNDEPDSLGTYSGVNPVDLANIAINRVVTSKIDNFLKPSFPSYLNINTADGPYLFHLNSYDWLHPNASPMDPPINAPTNLIGIAVNRGTIDANFPNPTPRDYAALIWDETSGSWGFGYLDPISGGVSSYTSFAAGDTTIYGHLTVDDGGNPAQYGTIRIPNSKEIVSRNASNTGDCSLISLDMLDRVSIGAPSVPAFFPGYQINDLFIAESSSLGGDLTDTATSGFIRLKYITDGISFKANFIAPNDSSIISTDGLDQLYIGDIYNNAITYNTSAFGAHIFLINNNFIAGIADSGFYFSDTLFSPVISQLSQSSGNGQNLIITAQSTSDAGGYGGSTMIEGGNGPAGDGYVDVKAGSTTRVRVYAATAPVVTDYTENSALNANSVVIYHPRLRFYNDLPTGADILFDPIDLSAGTAAPLTITGQENIGVGGTGGDTRLYAGSGTGVAATGGNLYLSSGGGTSANGIVTIQSGLNDRATFADSYQEFNVDSYGYYEFNIASSTIVKFIDDKLVSAKGRRRSVKPVASATYTIVNEDDMVAVDVSTTPITIYLPAGAVTGDTYDIKDAKGLANTNNITVDAATNGSTIDGNGSITINLPYSSVTLIFNGTEWNII